MKFLWLTKTLNKRGIPLPRAGSWRIEIGLKNFNICKHKLGIRKLQGFQLFTVTAMVEIWRRQWLTSRRRARVCSNGRRSSRGFGHVNVLGWWRDWKRCFDVRKLLWVKGGEKTRGLWRNSFRGHGMIGVLLEEGNYRMKEDLLGLRQNPC